MAKKVSEAIATEYRAYIRHLNEGTASYSYLEQPRDDLWSGTTLDTDLTRSQSALVMAPKGLTQAEMRALGDELEDTGGSCAASFCEATKSRGS